MKRKFFFALSVFAICISPIFYTSSYGATSLNWYLSDVRPTLRGVAYGSNTFAAVGDSGAVFTSADGKGRWAENYPAGTSNFNAITYGNGIFVAVGDDGISTSPDGITWITRVMSDNMTLVKSVVYANGIFIASGSDKMATSSDGTNWTVRDTGFTFTGMAYGSGVFIGVKGSSVLMTSHDGLTWADIATDYPLYRVAYGNGRFVAIGYYSYSVGFGPSLTIINVIMTSPDGTSWTLKKSDGSQLSDITYGNGTFAAVGSGGTIMTSLDTVNWDTWYSPPTYNTLMGVTYGNNSFVGVGEYATIVQADVVLGGNCTTVLSILNAFHIPIINFNDSYYSAYLSGTVPPVVNALYKLTNYEVVTDPVEFSDCQATTLKLENGVYKLHIPKVYYSTNGEFNDTFYSADFEYVPTTDGETWFKLTGGTAYQ